MLLETLREWGMGPPVGLRKLSDLGGGLGDDSFRACTAFTKDQSSVPRTHVKWLTVACNSNSSGAIAQETMRAPICACIYTEIHIYNYKS